MTPFSAFGNGKPSGEPSNGTGADHAYLVALYRDYMSRPEQADKLARAKAELRGKDLVCFCRLDQPCHADVLLEIANEVTK